MLKLTDEQKRLYQGELGPGMQKAMTMLVKYGNAYDADRMIRVDSTHTSPCFNPKYLSEILEGVGEVRALSSLHTLRICCTRWADDIVMVPELAEKEREMHSKNLKLFRKAGFLETFTCVPFLTQNLVRQGTIFSWSESSAVLAGNSIFGARGNRDSPPISLSCAITGFIPEMLLHRPEYRYARLLVHIEGLDVESLDHADLGAIGHYVGIQARDRNVAVAGLPSRLTYEELKYLLTPMGVSGAVALCHVIGVTPEAPTLALALGNQNPEDTIRIGKEELKQSYHSLNTAKTNDIETVLFGCPHATITEIRKVAKLLDGRKIKAGIRLWLLTSDVIYALAKRNGYVDVINNAGGLVITDTCTSDHYWGIFGLKDEFKRVATNSAKSAAYHGRSLEVHYGNTETCIAAALSGKWEGDYP